MFGDRTLSEETESQPETESGRRVRPVAVVLTLAAIAFAGLVLYRRRTASPKLEPPF